VPANTTATVHLPGQSTEPLRVGSGMYRWSCPYSLTGSHHRALSVDSPLDDLVDDASAYKRVMAIFAEHNPEFVARLTGQTGLSVRQAAELNPRAGELVARLEEALRERNGAA